MMNSRWNCCVYNRCSVLSAAATFHLGDRLIGCSSSCQTHVEKAQVISRTFPLHDPRVLILPVGSSMVTKPSQR